MAYMTDTTDLEKIKAKQSFICDMDTDIVAGIDSEINTCLVLSGITSRPEIADFPCRPDYVLNSVADIVASFDAIKRTRYFCYRLTMANCGLHDIEAFLR